MKRKILILLILCLIVVISACESSSSDISKIPEQKPTDSSTILNPELGDQEENSTEIKPTNPELGSQEENSTESKPTNSESQVQEQELNQIESITAINSESIDFDSYSTVNSYLYLKHNDVNYDMNDFSESKSVEYLKMTSIGELKIEGEYDYFKSGVDSYYITGNSLSFYYKQNNNDSTLGYDGYSYSVLDDYTDTMMGHAIGEVNSGAFMVFKSYDNGINWKYENASFVNIGNNIIKYTPSGDDINNGVSLKFIMGQKMYCDKVVGQKKKWIFWPFKYEMVDIIERTVYTCMQVSIIHLESGIISSGFYSNEVDYKYEDDDSILGEIINKSSSLTHNSITFDKIKYSTNGNKNLTTKCSYNGGELFDVNEGDVFTQVGEYRFNVSNSIGTRKKDITIYIVDKESLFFDYFKDNLVEQDKRVFDETSNVPVYMKGTALKYQVKDNMPTLYGNIYKVENGNIVDPPLKTIVGEEKIFDYELNETGMYCVVLYVGNKESSGQKVCYTFNFKVVNNPTYKPQVNYNLLKSTDRFLNMKRKAYAVNFYTSKGGSYVFLFPANLSGYNQAYEFGLNIEKRYIEKYEDDNSKYYYYRGKRYDSKVELYEKIEENVFENLYLTYINPLEVYGVEILSEDKLVQIENQILEKDVRVCLSQKIKTELCSNDIIINDFIFTQIANYECEKIVAIDEMGNEIQIPFNVNINSILNNTGKYIIREYNWCNIREYEVVFIKEGDNTSLISATIISESDETYNIIITKDTVIDTIDLKRIVFNKSYDELDSQSLVVITSIGFREVCLLKELDSYIYDLTEQGIYNIEVINRLGYSFSFSVNVSGNYIIEDEIGDMSNEY